jgi:hypothetical protein
MTARVTRLVPKVCVAAVLSAVLVVGEPAAATPGAPAAGPQPLNIAVSGGNGVGRITSPGRPCAEGGSGSYRHYGFESALAPGVVSKLAGMIRGSIDVHHDGPVPPVGPATSGAFLARGGSHITITNQRGAVRLQLASGDCAAPTLAFDGVTLGPGPGTWAIDATGTNGAYRGASSPGGTFTLGADLAPGADNAWAVQLEGSLTVLQPSLGASVVRTFWGSLGLDYLLRRVSVTYEVTNTGPGDAFGVSLMSATSPTAGVTPLGPTPVALGDLAAGETARFTVRYQLGLLAPCALVVLGCNFGSRVTVDLPDALDVPGAQSATAAVHAPDLPPPL